MEILRVEVTDDDIQSGLQRSGSDCPLARALQRTVGTGSVFVGTFHLSQRDGIRRRQGRHSLRSRRFVSSFDRKGAEAVRPGRFRIDFDEWPA